MKRIRQYLTRPLCLMLSIALLGSAMAVATLTGSPYDTAKDAAYKLLADGLHGDFAIKGEIYVNDVLYGETTQVTLGGVNTYLSHDKDGWTTYRNGDLYISVTGGSNHTNAIGHYNFNNGNGSYDEYEGTGFADEYPRNSTYVRLAEALMDTLVGDMKNHLSMSGIGDERMLSITLTAGQIPEMYNLLLSFAVSQGSGYSYYPYDQVADSRDHEYDYVTLDGRNKTIYTYRVDDDGNETLIGQRTVAATREDYGDDVFDVPLTEATIEYVSGRATIGKDNRLIEGSVVGRVILTDLFGETVIVEGSFEYSTLEKDLVVPECPIPNAAEFLNADTIYSMMGDSTRRIVDSGEYAYVNFNFNMDEQLRIIEDSFSVSNFYNHERMHFDILIQYDESGEPEVLIQYLGEYISYDELLTRVEDGDLYLRDMFTKVVGQTPDSITQQELCEMYTPDGADGSVAVTIMIP